MSAADVPDTAPATRLPAVPRRRLWVSLLLGLVIFVSGFVTGGGLTLIVLRNRVLAAIRHPVEEPARIADRLRRALDLTPQQTQRAEQVFRVRQAALEKIRRDVQPRVLAELDLLEQQIAELLNEPQREKWHAMFADLKSTWLPPARDKAETAKTRDKGRGIRD